jgi:hypothetical protein
MSFSFKLNKFSQISLAALTLTGAAASGLSAGQAQALALNDLAGKTITAGDKILSDITITGLTPTANQVINFSEASGAWVVVTTFTPDQYTTLIPSQANPAILSYKITITDPAKLFNRIGIQGDDNTLTGGTTSQKVTATGVAGTLDSVNGVNPGFQNFTSNVSTIDVTSTFYTDGQASFNSISQKFTQKSAPVPTPVPGPLPMLGLVSAFGFSRRLRHRIATQG